MLSASFVCRGRFVNERPSLGFESIAPDLAVETVSPWMLYSGMQRRVERFLEAGTQLFWIVNPELQFAIVHRGNGSTSRIREDEDLDGEGVLPGFSCRLGDLFLPPAESES